MGRPVNDWDVATSARPVDVARLFPKTVLTGEKFGTVTVLLAEDTVEVTTFRTESEYHDGRRPENVEFVSTLDEDLRRRDFTINAMAVSDKGEFIDPFDGIKDIERQIIRCVGGPNTRFSEDALRMFRAFRLSAELGFAIESETMQAICANVERASLISAERVHVELEKTLMSHRPELAGEMIKIGLLSRYVAVSGKSPDGVEKIADLPMEKLLRWCAFCAILLDKKIIKSSTEFLRDVRVDGKTTKTCSLALSIPAFPENRVGIKRLFAKYDVDTVRCAAAAHDTLHGGSALRSAGETIACGECFSLNKLAVTGGDLIALGHPPGRELGETLGMLLDHVIGHPEANVREGLLEMARKRI
jgi:tRNA nucleotidyltransferase (CCA-adding enzyme)